MRKLRKQGSSGAPVSKRIRVEDKEGNKHVLKATVVSVSRHDIKKGTTAEISSDRLQHLGIGERIVLPPLSQGELAVLSEYSSELSQVIESMAMGIEGFGGRLKKRNMSEADAERHRSGILEEKVFLDAFFKFPNPSDS